MTDPEDHQCPECFNDIYKPFTYCNSCGWEKGDEDEDAKKAKEKKAKKIGKDSKKKGEKGSKAETKEDKKEKVPKGKTVHCPKCGNKLDVESDKRPITIECEKCGAKGTLKAKPEKSDDDELKKEGKKKKRVKEPEDEPEEKEEDEEEEEEEKPKKKSKNKKAKSTYEKIIPCPGCGEDIIIRTKKRPVRIECDNCGKSGTIKK